MKRIFLILLFVLAVVSGPVRDGDAMFFAFFLSNLPLALAFLLLRLHVMRGPYLVTLRFNR